MSFRFLVISTYLLLLSTAEFVVLKRYLATPEHMKYLWTAVEIKRNHRLVEQDLQLPDGASVPAISSLPDKASLVGRYMVRASGPKSPIEPQMVSVMPRFTLEADHWAYVLPITDDPVLVTLLEPGMEVRLAPSPVPMGGGSLLKDFTIDAEVLGVWSEAGKSSVILSIKNSDLKPNSDTKSQDNPFKLGIVFIKSKR